VRLLIVSDTHVPQRARAVPAEIWDAARRCDAIVHAGDWVELALLTAFREYAPVLGVAGNNDGPDLHAELPEVARATLGGVRVAVVHNSGPTENRNVRCAAAYPDTDVLVFGHSHIPWDTTAATGLRLLNPGSPTDRRRQPHCTYLTAVADEGALHDVRLHRMSGCR
jgi:putative phosphoesterase